MKFDSEVNNAKHTTELGAYNWHCDSGILMSDVYVCVCARASVRHIPLCISEITIYIANTCVPKGLK